VHFMGERNEKSTRLYHNGSSPVGLRSSYRRSRRSVAAKSAADKHNEEREDDDAEDEDNRGGSWLGPNIPNLLDEPRLLPDACRSDLFRRFNGSQGHGRDLQQPGEREGHQQRDPSLIFIKRGFVHTG
jgi:hypothetical protein